MTSGRASVRYADLLAWFVAVWQVAYLRGVWTSLPERVPIHFGFGGQPDAYGSRGTLAWLVGLGLFIVVQLAVLERFPRLFNLPASWGSADRPRQEALARNLLSWVRLEVALLFAYTLWGVVQVAQQRRAGLGGMLSVAAVLGPVLTVLIFLWRMKRRPRVVPTAA